ncbi:MAG: kynureninase [Planctomycetota bacterium]
MSPSPTLEFARQLDQQDSLAKFREQFFLPTTNGQQDLYFVGNSLGLQPKSVRQFVTQELDKWESMAVRGHFTEPRPWLNYHEHLTGPMADLVGGKHDEVIVMNTLTVNLHLMMATFYRPKKGSRDRILIEAHAFPSDKNAVESQIRLHGCDPEESLIEIEPDINGEIFSTESICDSIVRHRDMLAMILLPGVQYYTGQVFDMQAITKVAREYEIPIGFDCAHAAGNVEMQLHDWGVDFACWCSYKYLNSGPGSLAGCFIHQRHVKNRSLPRMAGWWGHDEASRFLMTGEFSAIETAEGWQLSNPPILSMAAVLASLEVFREAGGMAPLRQKSREQHRFFRLCLRDRLGDQVTPIAPEEMSGCQLSLEVDLGQSGESTSCGKAIYEQLENSGIRTDWREPNVIRAAPTPLYNTFEEIWQFVDTLAERLDALRLNSL